MNYIIKDADGNITNPCIKASAEFMEANFEHYELWVEPTAPEPTVTYTFIPTVGVGNVSVTPAALMK